MKTTIKILLTIVSIITVSSCGGDEPDSGKAEPQTPRTVLVYMVAENNLSSYARRDVNEMIEAAKSGHFGDSRLLVYYDAPSSDPRLFEITSSGETQDFRTYSNDVLSVNTDRLKEVIEDSRSFAPAQRYGIIFWGHGSGYVQNGITQISTKSYGGEQIGDTTYWMNITSMAAALEGKKFDWIYFDCCFMAGIETAYELRNVTPYIIASATELPAEGMPYQRTLRHLMPYNSDLKGAASETFKYFDTEKSGFDRTCTISLIKTAGLDHLASITRSIYVSAPDLPGSYIPQAFQTDYGHKRYGWSYYDFEHYVAALAEGNASFRAAMDDVVMVAFATPKLWDDVVLSNHNGLSTLIVEKADDSNLDKYNYRDLSWWKDVVAYRFN